MQYQLILCPSCSSEHIKKNGKTSNRKQRYFCIDCNRQFILDYTYKACKAEVKHLIVLMTLNHSGIGDISRVLKASPTTVIKTIKQAADLLTLASSNSKKIEADE